MASERREAANEGNVLTSALAAAMLAGVTVGVLFHVTGRMEAVAGVYGLDGVVTGWGVLILHSLVAGLVFGAIVIPLAPGSDGVVGEALAGLGPYATSIVLGGVFGFLLWLVGVVVLMPLLIDTLGEGSASMPYFSGMSLVGLALFGFLLGGLFALVYERMETGSARSVDPL